MHWQPTRKHRRAHIVAPSGGIAHGAGDRERHADRPGSRALHTVAGRTPDRLAHQRWTETGLPPAGSARSRLCTPCVQLPRRPTPRAGPPGTVEIRAPGEPRPAWMDDAADEYGRYLLLATTADASSARPGQLLLNSWCVITRILAGPRRADPHHPNSWTERRSDMDAAHRRFCRRLATSGCEAWLLLRDQPIARSLDGPATALQRCQRHAGWSLRYECRKCQWVESVLLCNTCARRIDVGSNASCEAGNGCSVSDLDSVVVAKRRLSRQFDLFWRRYGLSRRPQRRAGGHLPDFTSGPPAWSGLCAHDGQKLRAQIRAVRAIARMLR